ncbi:hypothetical protein [Spirosoma aerophilum]
MRIIIELDTKDQPSVNVTPQPGTSSASNTLENATAPNTPDIDAGPAPGTLAEMTDSNRMRTTTGETNQLANDATSAGSAPDLTNA